MSDLADRIEAGEEEALCDAVAARLTCDRCGRKGSICLCEGGPYASPGVMLGALLDHVSEERAAAGPLTEGDAEPDPR